MLLEELYRKKTTLDFRWISGDSHLQLGKSGGTPQRSLSSEMAGLIFWSDFVGFFRVPRGGFVLTRGLDFP